MMNTSHRLLLSTAAALLTTVAHVHAALVPAANIRFDMYAGRLPNVPVSSFYESPAITLASTVQKPFFYASCKPQNIDSGGGMNVSDVSAILVIRDLSNRVVDIKYDDRQSPCGYGGTDGGMVFGRNDGQTYKYSFIVVSNRRNTALCTMGQADTMILDANGPGTCSLGTRARILASNVQVGGSLIKVGPLPEGDTFELQTPNNGADVRKDRVRMLLLRVDDKGAPAATSADFAGVGDFDPKLTVPRGYADTTENFILLGKAGTTTEVNEGVETRVDLLHGPLNQIIPGGSFVPGGSLGLYLTPGRWNFEVTAAPGHAVGSLARGENRRSCDVADSLGYVVKRGELNRPGFRLRLDQNSSGVWTRDWSVRERLVPLGAFGNDSHLHSLYLNKEIVASAPVRYRPEVSGVAGDWSWGTWNIHRNPDNVAMTFITQNMLYRDTSPAMPRDSYPFMPYQNYPVVEDEVNEYRNAAHLFGNRGTISRSALRVNDPTDRGPHEWDGDVVVLTEGNDTPGDPRRLQAFIEEATSTGSRSWDGTQQIGENWNWYAPDSNNMILMASNVDPGVICEKDVSGACRRRDIGSQGPADLRNWLVPGFAQARRQIGSTQYIKPGENTPVAVMAVHLDTSRIGRLNEIHDLAVQMEDVLRANPKKVNRYAAGDPRASDPRGEGNRFVVIGDLNVQHHRCGEAYPLLKILRDRFGYAVDIAMAMDDATGNSRHYAMHNQNASLSGDTPVPYMSNEEWKALVGAKWRQAIDPPSQEDGMHFPWWAGTSVGDSGDMDGGSHERLDQIWLVGRGWEKDDVGSLDYRVLSAIKRGSPFSVGNAPYGVETWRNSTPGMETKYRLSGSMTKTATCSTAFPFHCDYRPYFPVLGGGTSVGDAALHTDHLAVKATVPIFGGAGRR